MNSDLLRLAAVLERQVLEAQVIDYVGIAFRIFDRASGWQADVRSHHRNNNGKILAYYGGYGGSPESMLVELEINHEGLRWTIGFYNLERHTYVRPSYDYSGREKMHMKPPISRHWSQDAKTWETTLTSLRRRLEYRQKTKR